jgi:hypothetical protein
MFTQKFSNIFWYFQMLFLSSFIPLQIFELQDHYSMEDLHWTHQIVMISVILKA